jgi:hypothetical protein
VDEIQPGGSEFDPSILGHSAIYGAADEAVLNKVLEKIEKVFFSRFPANESLRRTGLHLYLSAKSSFYLPAFEICRSCRTASVHVVPPLATGSKVAIFDICFFYFPTQIFSVYSTVCLLGPIKKF